MYIVGGKTHKLQVHGLQVCFVVAHSSGDLTRTIFTIAYIQYNLIYAARNLTVYFLRRRALFLWRQEDTSSLRLFNVDSSGRQMIRNFSLRQRLHLLLELLYGEYDERMCQEIVFNVVVFEGPDVLAEFSGVSVLSVAE